MDDERYLADHSCEWCGRLGRRRYWRHEDGAQAFVNPTLCDPCYAFAHLTGSSDERQELYAAQDSMFAVLRSNYEARLGKEAKDRGANDEAEDRGAND